MDEISISVKAILNEIDEEIIEYDGDNLIDEGLVDSFAIVTILAMVEEKMHISVNPEDVKETNFKTVASIVDLIRKYKERQ